HEYSTDEDTYPADALDPRTNIWDLGSDPLGFAKQRTAYIAGLWKSPQFEPRVVGAAGDFTVLRRAMDTLLAQYTRALGLGIKYGGGQFGPRHPRGRRGAKAPREPIAAARQRDALDFLSQRCFAADALTLPPALLNRLAPDRWTHWGNPNGFSGPFRL